MKRPDITVVTEDGKSYDASVLLIGADDTLTVMCSGTPTTLMAQDVKRIEWRAEAESFCPHCERP